MTEIKEDTALLDKMEIGGVTILEIKDLDYLVAKGIIEISTSKVKYITAAGQEFTRLNIEGDELIDKMIAGSKIMGNKKINYCNLSTSIKNRKMGNLVCYTFDQYLDQFIKIQERLETEYGIIADFSDMTIKEIEINRTFKLNGSFEDYHRVIQLIMTNLPSYMRNQMDCKKIVNGNSEFQTYYAQSKTTNKSKRYLLLKIYNKSKAVENIILLTDSYMRVEFRLCGAEKVKKALKTNKFAELSDKLINGYFDAQIEKMIVQPFNKWKKDRDKYLFELIAEQRQSEYHWLTNVLRILQNEEIAKKRPVLLDVEEIIPIIDKLKLKSKKRNEIKANFRKQAKQYESVFCNADDKKMTEILEKLTVKAPAPSVQIDPGTGVDAPSNLGTVKTA